jgi:hypothetical protein
VTTPAQLSNAVAKTVVLFRIFIVVFPYASSTGKLFCRLVRGQHVSPEALCRRPFRSADRPAASGIWVLAVDNVHFLAVEDVDEYVVRVSVSMAA